MKNKLIFILGLIIPSLFVFKQVFLKEYPAFGDAPYFYPEALEIFKQMPLAWWNIGNGLGGTNLFIFIAPLMYIYSYFGVKLTFYIPSIIFSFLTPIIFARYFKFSKTIQFFSSLIYGLNTYFILLLDGGQVGVALAYSIFPYVLLQLYKENFVKSLLSVLTLTLIDPRITVISFITYFLWQPKKIFKLFKIAFFLVFLNAFWILPLIKNGGGDLDTQVSSLGFIKLTDSLFLHQPHWSENVYGQTFKTPMYFIIVPILIFIGFLFKNKKNNKNFIKFGLMFLLFVFLAKGENPPLGFIYQFMVNKFPFGSALRDSSKFFIPLMLFGGILIGNSLNNFKSYVLRVVSYLFILFLITPAILGKMNFVLSDRVWGDDYQKIYKNITANSGIYKTLWFPERPTLGFQSKEIPSIDAKTLTNLRPLASLNGGSSDVFNFFNHKVSSDWLKILGVKYLFFPGDTRKFEKSDEEIKNWEALLKNINQNTDFTKLDWGTKIPVYELTGFKQQSFKVKKMLAVVGGEDVYSKYNINPLDTGVLFLEDGKTDAGKLLDLPEGSLELLYNQKYISDLRFSFLKNYFLNQDDISTLEWAKYKTHEYLLWKYQLLIRGIDTKENDYQKGIFLSTQKDEKLTFSTNIKKEGKYLIGIRGMGYFDNKLKIEVEGNKTEDVQKEGSFGWQYFEFDLKKGKRKITLTNLEGIQIINTVAVVPFDEWLTTEKLAIEFEKKFAKTDEVDGLHWLIFSQNYHPQLELNCNGSKLSPVAVYSMINGYLVNNCPEAIEPVFSGQKYVELGVKISTISFVIILLWAILSKKLKN